MLNAAADTAAGETDTIGQATNVSSFTLGLIAGGMIGATLALAFAPRAGEDLRRRVASAAKNLGDVASKRADEASHDAGADRVCDTAQPASHRTSTLTA